MDRGREPEVLMIRSLPRPDDRTESSTAPRRVVDSPGGCQMSDSSQQVRYSVSYFQGDVELKLPQPTKGPPHWILSEGDAFGLAISILREIRANPEDVRAALT